MINLGFVSLVGAGPGVKDHLTMRAADRLQRANLVLYDALVDRSILELCDKAQRFYVGKRAGRHSMSQEAIISLLVRAAKAGKRVVRLKAGDPFVLGRGGEEALALGQASIPYEVVPGLSSALASPAFGGVPVTHRGLSAACVLVSGHHSSAYSPVLGRLSPLSVTVVVLMGFAERHEIAQLLVDKKWPVSTPATMIAGAGTLDQRIWYGSLGALAEPTLPFSEDLSWNSNGAPVTIVIGKTVGLSESIEHPPVADRSGEYLALRYPGGRH
ncbi:MAG: uroporphyrinogen-III C-methyltransferase [Myxococcales bacterium]|nr:uroporphyrinogen-III C-methyltransferase [Myxococcales bacterium]